MPIASRYSNFEIAPVRVAGCVLRAEQHSLDEPDRDGLPRERLQVELYRLPLASAALRLSSTGGVSLTPPG